MVKKYLRLDGGKLAAAEVKEELKSEPKSVSEEEQKDQNLTEPAKEETVEIKTGSLSSLPGEMFNLSINTVEKAVGKPLYKSGDKLMLEGEAVYQAVAGGSGVNTNTDAADDTNDDEVFLESNPNAPIYDAGSPDTPLRADQYHSHSFFNEAGVSPPGMDPVLQANTLLQTFHGALKSAQKEVHKEAEDAMGLIARNLRAVESRSLKCLEREMSVERREAELLRKENNLKRPRDNYQFPSFPMSMAEMDRNGIVDLYRPVFGAKKQKLDYDGLVGRITSTNKRGKPYFTYVDDAYTPAIVKARPDYTLVPAHHAQMPWLHRGAHKLQARHAEMNGRSWRSRPGQAERYEGRYEDPRSSRGPGGYKKKPRGRFYDPMPRSHCKPNRGHKREDDGDDEDHSRGQRTGGRRERCHSNVMIRNNVRVNH